MQAVRRVQEKRRNLGLRLVRGLEPANQDEDRDDQLNDRRQQGDKTLHRIAPQEIAPRDRKGPLKRSDRLVWPVANESATVWTRYESRPFVSRAVRQRRRAVA